MAQSELDQLRMRVDMVEAQSAMLVTFTRMLVHLHIDTYPMDERDAARGVFEKMFEKVTAQFLASDNPDAMVTAVELLRTAMFGCLGRDLCAVPIRRF